MKFHTFLLQYHLHYVLLYIVSNYIVRNFDVFHHVHVVIHLFHSIHMVNPSKHPYSISSLIPTLLYTYSKTHSGCIVTSCKTMPTTSQRHIWLHYRKAIDIDAFHQLLTIQFCEPTGGGSLETYETKPDGVPQFYHGEQLFYIIIFKF